MNHLTEEQLIEHYYSKGGTGGAAGRHLDGCAACARGYAALKSDLDEVEIAAPPARDASYGEWVWESLAPSLPVYAAPRRRWFRAGVWKGLSYAAACALLVACAFIAGRLWERRQPNIAVKPPAPQPAPPQRVVVVVLSDHLDRSERLLVELKHADTGSAELLSPLRDEARSLQVANRICRQNAGKDDDPALSAALDRLDRLLAELANQPGGLNGATIARLQDEMSAEGLLFKVRVLRSRIPDRQSGSKTKSQGGTT